MNRLPLHPLLRLVQRGIETLSSPLGGLLVVIAVMILYGCAYTIDQTEQVVITQFGRPVGQPLNISDT
ncbi:MAG: hypothetical protein MUQ48_04560, partial [Pirellulales bacterium]|nr:hypothetical protein [Pirellulales bacterium]